MYLTYSIKILFILVIYMFIVGCNDELSTIDRPITESDLYIDRATDVEILYSDSAVVRMSIKAPLLLNYTTLSKERKEFPNGIEVDFFNESGQTTSEMNAKYATQYERENRIVIQDSVVVTSINNEMLETDELIWDEKNKQLYTDKWVKVTTPNEVIYGYGFSANQEFTQWTIRKVSGRFTVDDFRNDF